MGDPEAAFLLMKKLVTRKRKSNPNPLKLPHCLAALVEEGVYKKLPCCMCGKVFNSPDQLLVHSHFHSSKDNFQNECCFCGRSFEDEFSLEMHQMSAPIINKCSCCFQVFDEANDLIHHTCTKKSRNSRVDTKLVCKLGCSREREFPTEEYLEMHLFSLHGASTDDEVCNNDAMKFCIMCKGFVNAYRLSLEDHTFFRCTGRHQWVKQAILGLYQLAKEQSLNLSMLIQLELEAQLEEWKARDCLKGQDVQKGIIQVLPNVSKDIVMKCLGSNDKKYSQNETEFVLPTSFNLYAVSAINARTDSIKLFHMWNKAVELNINARNNTVEDSKEFTQLAASFYKTLNDRLPQLNDEKKRFKVGKTQVGKVYKRLDNFDMPPDDVLARLQLELGEVASPHVLRKQTSFDKSTLQANGMSIRDFESPKRQVTPEMNFDDFDQFDPSDFLQMEQREGDAC